MKIEKALCVIRFNATIEFLRGQKAAIITLETLSGEWAGSGRIDLRRGSRRDLYEVGYIWASQSAASKDGIIETYKVGRRALRPRARRARCWGLSNTPPLLPHLAAKGAK